MNAKTSGASKTLRVVLLIATTFLAATADSGVCSKHGSKLTGEVKKSVAGRKRRSPCGSGCIFSVSTFRTTCMAAPTTRLPSTCVALIASLLRGRLGAPITGASVAAPAIKKHAAVFSPALAYVV